MAFKLIDYSEKAFAVLGDTKPVKDQLKALGGKFNPHLKCGAGWIFSKKKLNEVTAAFVCESPNVGSIPYYATLSEFLAENQKEAA
jgi:hypothetical protein